MFFGFSSFYILYGSIVVRLSPVLFAMVTNSSVTAVATSAVVSDSPPDLVASEIQCHKEGMNRGFITFYRVLVNDPISYWQ